MKAQRTLLIPIVAILAAVLAGPQLLTAGPGRSRTVYYQVTYSDGTVKDLSQLPATNENIHRVMRIIRLGDNEKSYKVLSSVGPVLTISNDGRTITQDMTWDGKKWTPVTFEDESKGKADAELKSKMQARLIELLRKRPTLKNATVAAKLNLKEARKADDEAALSRAKLIVDGLEYALDLCETNIKMYEKALGIDRKVEKKLPGELPSPKSAVGNNDSFVVVVSGESGLTVAGRRLKTEQLGTAVGRLPADRRKLCRLQVNRDARWQRVTEVFKALKQAGVENISFGILHETQEDDED